MKKRFLAVVMGLVITVSMITGCSEKNSSDSSSNTASSDAASSSDDASSSNSDNSNSYASAEVSEYTIYGKVKSVSDDGKITYEVLSRDENQPQKPHGSGAPDAKNGEKPQKPHGSGAPDAKNGEKPHGSGAPDAKGGMPGFKSTGETSTVTLGDNVTVQKAGMSQEKTDASVSDIKKGCIIEIALDGDNVSKVLIREETGKNAKNTDKETSGSGNSTN